MHFQSVKSFLFVSFCIFYWHTVLATQKSRPRASCLPDITIQISEGLSWTCRGAAGCICIRTSLEAQLH